MTSYATLAARSNARQVFWLEISGIPYAFSDGFITEANKATLFTDSYTSTLTFVAALMPLRTVFAKSIELLSGEGQTGGLDVGLMDVQTAAYPDGLITWLFGGDRLTIVRTKLTADVEMHVGGAGHNWTVASSTSFPDSGTVYCELESASYATKTNPTLLNTVTRSKFKSPATAHRDYPGFAVYPDVTDHPTQWHGRIVTLYQNYVDVDGTIAGTAATARAVAYPMRGILRDLSCEENVWTLRCDGIDSLLERKINRAAPHAKASPSVVIPDAGSGTCSVVKVTEELGGNVEMFAPAIAAGTYDLATFLQALNTALETVTSEWGAAAFDGELTILASEREFSLTYRSGANAKSCSVIFTLGQNGVPVVGFFSHYPLWIDLGLILDYDIEFIDVGPRPGDVVANTLYAPVVILRHPFTLDLTRGTVEDLLVTQDAEDSPIASFSTAFGSDWIIIESSAGKQTAEVVSVTAATRTIRIDTGRTGFFHDTFVHTGTAAEPIRIRRLFMSEAGDTLRSVALKLLLSTGVTAYNDATYDTLADGVGIEFPNETINAGVDAGADALIDRPTFDRFFFDIEPLVSASVREFIDAPVSMREWLVKRLRVLGGYLLVDRGQLTIRHGLFAMPHQGTRVVDRTNTVVGPRSVSRPSRSTIGGVVIKHKYSHATEKYMQNSTFLLGRAEAVTIEVGGLSIDYDQALLLATDLLLDYGLENPRYSLSVDRSLADIEAGEIVSFSDEGAGDTTSDSRRYHGLPNMDGTRGHAGTRAIVLSARTDWSKGDTELELMQTRRKVGGFSASAWITSHTTAAGKTTLTCAANVFGSSVDGVDASRFAVGDKVLVLAIGPTTTENGEQAFEINSITGNEVALLTAIDVAGANAHFASGQPLALVHDEYQTGSQTATAKQWCHIGDASGDVGDTLDDAYQW